MLRALLAAWLAANALSCTALRHWWSPKEGYVSVGTPAQPLETATAICLDRSEFTSGFSWYQGHDWNEFGACMNELGWKQESSPASRPTQDGSRS